MLLVVKENELIFVECQALNKILKIRLSTLTLTITSWSGNNHFGYFCSIWCESIRQAAERNSRSPLLWLTSLLTWIQVSEWCREIKKEAFGKNLLAKKKTHCLFLQRVTAHPMNEKWLTSQSPTMEKTLEEIARRSVI